MKGDDEKGNVKERSEVVHHTCSTVITIQPVSLSDDRRVIHKSDIATKS